MIAATTVHTSGVNWESVLVIIALVTTILSFWGTVIIRSLKNSVKDQITAVLDKTVMPELRRHDTRIARLEGVQEGERKAIAAASVTTTNTS